MSSLDSDCDPSTNSNNHNKNDEVVQNDLDDNDVKEDDDRTATAALLSYLPDGGQSLPPQIQALVARVTHFYVYGTPLLPSPSATAAEASISSFPSFSSVKSLEDISALIEVEHRSKDVPVVIGHDDDDDNLVLDVTATGEDLDETVAKVLSLAAFYRLPQPIALELLLQFPPTGLSTLENPSIWNELVATFAASGWEAVSFPHGLAIRPRTKFRWSMDITNNNSDISNSSSNIEKSNRQGQRRARLSWWHRTRTLQAEAELAVQAAAAAPAPPQQHPRTPLLKPLEFLQTMEAQLLLLRPEKEELSSDTAKQLRRSRSSTAAPDATEIMLFNDDSANSQLSTVSSTAATTAAAAPTMTALSQLFFPHNKHENIGVFRRMRRLVSKQYSALKRQGRAGFVAYCCFNCLYYTVGILWQWPRMAAIGDPLTSNLSVATLVARKFGTVFAYLYALSQLAKIPKLFTSVALAPLAGRGLELLQKRLRINETAATIVMVGATVVLWFAVISLPVFSEYATLQRIVRLDEQLVQVYGLQPV